MSVQFFTVELFSVDTETEPNSILLCYRYIIVVEHDLSVLDYLSDFICCLYGVPSAYGVVTMPFSVREGASSEPSLDLVTSRQSRLTTSTSPLSLPRHQHLPGRLRPHGEPQVSRDLVGLQGGRDGQ